MNIDKEKLTKLFKLGKDTTGKSLQQYEDLINKEFKGYISPHIQDALLKSKTVDEFLAAVKRFEDEGEKQMRSLNPQVAFQGESESQIRLMLNGAKARDVLLNEGQMGDIYLNKAWNEGLKDRDALISYLKTTLNMSTLDAESSVDEFLAVQQSGHKEAEIGAPAYPTAAKFGRDAGIDADFNVEQTEHKLNLGGSKTKGFKAFSEKINKSISKGGIKS